MKANIPWKGSNAERKAMHKEIGRQIVLQSEKYATDFDAAVLYTLHLQYGFGKDRLRKFWEAFIKQREELSKYYEMQDDYAFICKEKLKQIGVDVQAWEDELKGR